MNKTVSTKLDDEVAKKLEKIAEKEYLKPAALIRKFILQKLKEYDIKEIADL